MVPVSVFQLKSIFKKMRMDSSQPCLKYFHYKLGSSLWAYYVCFQKVYVQVLMVNPQLLWQVGKAVGR